MSIDRVVLDANIYVSLILKQKLNELVIWRKDYGIELYTCEELSNELTSVLGRKHIIKELNLPAPDYLSFINKLTVSTKIDQRFDRAIDVKDNYLFDLAYSVKSNYLVTGDRPLLNMKQVNKIKIISLSEWRKLVAQV